MALNNRGRGGKHVTRESRTDAHPYYRPASKDDLHCQSVPITTVESTYRLHRGMDTKKLEELLAQKEEVHFREVYKADKDSELNCVDVKSSQEASGTRSDPMEGEVPQQILDETLDLENSK
ncbi:unnamed protein product [Orchesella dallaii]|uniref:Uncharacterized protein n=1 Tax=Orchesella dallaii TaxID=48710 RepID=A0ABP1SAE3_9HEXA